MTTEEKLAAINATLPGLELPEASVEVGTVTITVTLAKSMLSEHQLRGLLAAAERLDLRLWVSWYQDNLRAQFLPLPGEWPELTGA